MAGIPAAAVKSLREKTGLPMMECKRALTDTDGNEDAAIDWLRRAGVKMQQQRSDRETAFGRFGIYTSTDPAVGAMVELKCESSPVTKHDEFIQLASDLAQQLATGPGASTVEQLLEQPSPSQQGKTLAQQKDELFNRIREVFQVGRIRRIDGSCGGYGHNLGTISGVLIQYTGGTPEVAKDIAMHVTASNPQVLDTDQLDADQVAKEREILAAAARTEGKPEKIIEKMVEGRMRSYFAEHELSEQPFIKDDKLTVAKYAASNGMKVIQFVHWVLGKE